MELHKDTIYYRGKVAATAYGLSPLGNGLGSVHDLAKFVKRQYISRFKAGNRRSLPIDPLRNMEGTELRIIKRQTPPHNIELTMRQGLSTSELEEFAVALTERQ